MSETDNDKDVTPVEEDIETRAAVTEEPEAPPTAPPQKRSGNSVAWLAFLFAIIALAGSGYMAWNTWQGAADTTADDQLARVDTRVSDVAGSLADIDARLAELGGPDPAVMAELSALRSDLDERLRLLNSLPARMSTLESSVASLAGVSEGARDAWVLAESEYYMQIANAQLQLANNPHLASLALRMADERIVQLANPALTDVRRALSDELAALDTVDRPDIEGATLKLSSLAKVVGSLPLANAAEEEEDAAEIDAELSGAGRAWASVKNAMSGLVTTTSVEDAKLISLSPNAENFLRSNIALQLQSARLALLRGEQAVFEQTLDDTSALLNDYFDVDSTQVANALETIAEVRGHVFTTAMPDISGSLQLLRQYRSLNENAQ